MATINPTEIALLEEAIRLAAVPVDQLSAPERRSMGEIALQKLREVSRLRQSAMSQPDPIFAVLAEYPRRRDADASAYKRLDEAEGQTAERRPGRLIAWRHHSQIGGSAIDRAREEFLALPGADAEQIEQEYREAKAREQAAGQAEEDWYARNGLAELNAESDKAHKAHMAALLALLTTQPTTVAGVIALLDYAAAHSGERAKAEGVEIFGWADEAISQASENFYRHLADSLQAIVAPSL